MPRHKKQAQPYQSWSIPKLRAALLNKNVTLHGGEKRAKLIKLWENAQQNNQLHTQLRNHEDNQHAPDIPPNWNDLSQSTQSTTEVTHKSPEDASSNLSQQVIQTITESVVTATVQALSPYMANKKSSPYPPGTETLSDEIMPPSFTDPKDDTPVFATRGVPSSAVPRLDIVAPSLRKDILAGKDINLASLLIPNYQESVPRELCIGESTITMKPIQDSRLNRALTPQEFQIAFSIYKKVVCNVYPQRREELDDYMSDVLKMANQFPGLLFYEYHKQFSANAAQLLEQQGVKVDWSVRDPTIFISLFTGQKANACAICGSVSHATHFCPESANKPRPKNYTDTLKDFKRESAKGFKDRHGRSIIQIGGRQICNNYNSVRGCNFSLCRRAHVCATCSQEHPQTLCSRNYKQPNPSDTK